MTSTKNRVLNRRIPMSIVNNKIEWNYSTFDLTSAKMNMRCSSPFITSIFAHSTTEQVNKFITDYWRDMHNYMFSLLTDTVVCKVASGEKYTPELVENTIIELEKEFQSMDSSIELPVEPKSAILATIRSVNKYITTKVLELDNGE